jgi:hypothetical protein
MREIEQQVAPLRYAPVGMTILFGNRQFFRKTPSLQQTCHPDRSEAEWSDLLFHRRH